MKGYISIQKIAEDLAEHPLLRNVSFERIINYTQEVIRLIGSPKLFIEKAEVVIINQYRGMLPCDYIHMIQVRGLNGEEYVPTMDNFFTSDKKSISGSATYKIQGDIIFTSNKDKDIEVSYYAIPVDENGWPLLPDNASFLLAFESYIKVKVFTTYFEMNQLQQTVLMNAQQEYAWRAGQAQNEFVLPSEDDMETLTRVWNNLIIRTTSHKNGFATEHNREYLKNH